MPKKGYRQTPEHKAKIAAALKGKPLTKVRRKNISRGMHRHFQSNLG